MFLVSLLAATQGVVGVPLLNDFSVNGVNSPVSCTEVLAPGGGSIPFVIRGSEPELAVAIMFSYGDGCCLPCWIPANPLGCPIPNGGCLVAGLPTNQSLDIVNVAPCFFAPIWHGNLLPDPAGGPTGWIEVSFDFMPGLVFGTQALIVDPACESSLSGMLMSQAYRVIT